MKSMLAVLRVDLNLLLRSPGSVLATLLYGTMVLVIVHFSIPAGSGQSRILGTAALWLALVLSGVLGLPRLQHDPDAVRFLPQLMTGHLSTSGYYWAKLLSGGLVMGFTALVLFPIGVVLFDFPLGVTLGRALAVYALGTFGVVVILTIGGVLTVGREHWLLTILVFPLMIPIVVAGAQLMIGILRKNQLIGWAWVHLLVSYDALMMFGGWFLSEFIWEELPE